jgi:Asp-tRNA(Asn)/Glu-tRNA(Gln) amidotransferase C subunit
MDELLKGLKEIHRTIEKNQYYIGELEKVKDMLKEVIKIINRNKLLTNETKEEMKEKLKDIIDYIEFKKKFYGNFHLI